MGEVDEVPLREVAHPCIWDRMLLMVHIVKHAFLASTWVLEAPRKVVCAQHTFSWGCLAQAMAHLHDWFFDEF